ncbi:MAG: sulfotransferase domain-containing protein [Planctomycetota bacterium]
MTGDRTASAGPARADATPPNLRLIVAEYPKSGGVWLVSLLGDALHLPKRDIYTDDSWDQYDLTNHPWYEGASSLGLPPACVIKSHELPGSKLHEFAPRSRSSLQVEQRELHLLRDGRDVIVSKYFFETEFCARNGLPSAHARPFDDYVLSEATRWRDYVTAWLAAGTDFVRYEDLLADPAGRLATLCASLAHPLSEARIAAAVAGNTRARLHAALGRVFQHNTFVRRGVAGDWKRHFSSRQADSFWELAGGLLERLGYPRAGLQVDPGPER